MNYDRERSALLALESVARTFGELRTHHAAEANRSGGAAYHEHYTLSLRFGRWAEELRPLLIEARRELR